MRPGTGFGLLCVGSDKDHSLQQHPQVAGFHSLADVSIFGITVLLMVPNEV